MSYDLHVHARDELDHDTLVELAAQVGLSPMDDGPSHGVVPLVRGARRRYSCTLERPLEVEVEDVPLEVTPLLLESRFVYSVLVEGSDPTEVPHATRLARAISRAAGGVVVDEQEGTTWSRGSLREAPRVESGEVEVVEVRWWFTGGTDVAGVAAAWLEGCRRHLPEALPRRWGDTEPLQERADPDDPEAFARFVARTDAGSSGAAWRKAVYLRAWSPAVEGSVHPTGPDRPVGDISLVLHRDPLHDEGWRRALQRLVVDVADRTAAVLVTAEVLRGVSWSGRSLGYTGRSERSAWLGGPGGWLGLPPYPVWWEWFGRDYLPLVEGRLDEGRTQPAGTGLLHVASEEPLDRDELTHRLGAERSGLRRRAWLPSDLLARRPLLGEPADGPPGWRPARTRPDSFVGPGP